MPYSLPPLPPVSVSEITFLIGQLKKGNAPGADLIPPKLMKNNIECWTPILTSPFNYILHQ